MILFVIDLKNNATAMQEKLLTHQIGFPLIGFNFFKMLLDQREQIW